MSDLTSIERTWYQTKVSGANAQTPVHQLRMTYWRAQTGSGSKYHDELEKQWLIFEIADAGGVATGRTLEQLWRELVAARGFRVSKFVNENRLTFYLNA